jgi:hypothetical protein
MCNSYESRSVSARAESYKKVRKQIYLKKFFTSPCFLGSGIRDGKKSGSRINIPDPQHCWLESLLAASLWAGLTG